MHMRDYPTYYTFTQIKTKKQRIYCCSTFHSHGRVFNDESIYTKYPKISVNGH